MGRIKTIADEEVLEAARRVFRRAGHAATTRDVAREAGISQAVLYQRFKTKKELFFAAMAPPPLDLADLLGDATQASRDGAQAHLKAIARRLYEHLGRVAPSLLHLATHPAFGASVIGRAHSRIGADTVGKAIAERVRALQAEGQIASDADPEVFATALIAVVHGLALHNVVAGSIRADHRYLNRLVAAMWRGLRP